MATRRLFKTVPKFTAYEVKLAELCAMDLWSGINYETGEEMEVSDEEFLADFAIPFQLLRKNPKTNNQITEFSIRRLIRVGKIKAAYRSQEPTNFQSGIETIVKKVIPVYDGWRNKTLKLTPIGYGERVTLDLGAGFVTNSKPSLNGNYRIALASRLLFFAVPDMLLFNFSNDLAESMLFQKRPQAAIPYFMEALQQGLLVNRTLFNKLELPPSKLLGTALWKRIKKFNWWQRRVLDLALMLHFGVVTARPALRTKARRLTAKPKKAKI
jgi:hypothetical protein